jgi:tRNA-dihydrouridine synthase A
MMDWTDRHCRAFHRVLAPGARLYTEMLHAQALLHGAAAHLLEQAPGERPTALQLGGSDPLQLAAAACIGAAHGYDEINLNVGCPSERVQAGRFGACLMHEPALVADCVRAMQDAVSIPVTVKCRIGVDEQDAEADLDRFVETLLRRTRLRVLIVHARKAWLSGLSPAENRSVPPLDYARVHRLKQRHPQLTVVLNGGLTDVAAAQAQLAHVDGVMLGRAAYHDPWVLACLDAELRGVPPPLRAAALRAFRPYVESELARGTALKHITRHLPGLYLGQPGARRFRRALTEGAVRADTGWELIEQALAQVERI